VASPEFETYFSLRERGALREAYAELRTIMKKHSRWSKQGDLYVWCAEFELLVYHNVDKAQELLDEAATLGCVHMAPYHGIQGTVLCEKGDRLAGIEEYCKCVALDPSDFNMATLLSELSAVDGAPCVRVCEGILRQNPTHCIAHVYLAREAQKKGNAGKALLLAKRAERMAHSAIDFYEIGRLYHELEEFRSAADAFLQAERLGFETKGVIYATLADCHFAMEEDDIARNYLAWALRHDPQNEYVKAIKDIFDKELGQEHGAGP
jgi:tetratricopeptide (TPR) repeat protein